MDRLDSMRLLVRVIERRSFTAAASDLDIPRSTATEAIKQLEHRLGVRLLERTTRVVTPTLDGEAYYRRCLSILVEIEEAESAFQDAMPRGLLRIDVHPMIARTFLIPHLPAFLDRYPQIDLHLGEGDRLVDLVREGVDCVIRAGEPTESGMIMRKLAMLREMTCASPAYLLRHGTPVSPDDLDGHRMIGYLSSRTNEIIPLEFTEGTKLRYVTLASRVTVSGADAMAELARYGLGLIQAPRYRFTEDFAAGTLVEILTDFPPKLTPLFALYPQSRQLSPRVRAFIDWAVDIFAAASV
jgi:DNA-binding transcriptional LysR family regulator